MITAARGLMLICSLNVFPWKSNYGKCRRTSRPAYSAYKMYAKWPLFHSMKVCLTNNCSRYGTMQSMLLGIPVDKDGLSVNTYICIIYLRTNANRYICISSNRRSRRCMPFEQSTVVGPNSSSSSQIWHSPVNINGSILRPRSVYREAGYVKDHGK